MSINWFPGHMHKARKEINDKLSQIDVVIEICDARLPFSSQNPMISHIIGNKPIIKILNKSDLADPDKTQAWLDYYESQHQIKAIALSCDQKTMMQTIPSLIKQLVAEKVNSVKPIYAVILGIPNVGKSTLINSLIGKVKAKVGNEPAVTKGQQLIQLDEHIYLIDTPGMLWPKIINENSAYRLAISGAIKDTAFEHDDIAFYAASFLLKDYPDRILKRYQLEQLPDSEEALIEGIGKKRGCVRRGGHVDFQKASILLIHDIRSKTLGLLTFELPESVIKENEYFSEQESKKIAARSAKKLSRSKKKKKKKT